MHRKSINVIFFFLILGLILGGVVFASYRHFYANKGSDGGGIFSKKIAKPQTTANIYDGTQTEKGKADRHALAIIVENHPDARPQVGLDKASIIYEAISEGGITRFMAIFGPRDAEKVGPVRSMRTYFLDWAWEYNAFLGHVGGNIDALDRIPKEGALDLDQFALGAKAYWREPQAGKATEHTMYTTTSKLYEAAAAKSWNMKETDFKPFKFLNADNFDYGSGQDISIDFSSASYKVSYAYDAASKTYLRTMAGIAHKDAATGNQLSPTNVIIQSVDRHAGVTRINEDSWTMDTIGNGNALVFYGGKEIKATWKKQDLKSRTKFYDEEGFEIKFLPGQFWYEITPLDVFKKVKVTEG